MNVEQAAPAYFAIIPASVLHDKELPPNAKLLYGDISALSHKSGECWPTNAYFQQLYNVDESSVRRWIRLLVKRGYITMRLEYIEGTKAVSKRVLSPAGGGCKNAPSGVQNYTQCGGKNAPLKRIEKQSPAFTAPSLDEIKAYCAQTKSPVDPMRFWSFYQSRGWMMGSVPMSDWRAAVTSWACNDSKRKGVEEAPLEYI